MRSAFGDCVLDGDTREVFRGGRAVAVSPKAFELLELLVEERPRAVSKEAIHERLWPKTFVSDASLSNLVAELRAALGDDAENPRLIRTVRRFGYAFLPEVRRASSAPPAGGQTLFRLAWEGRDIELAEGESFFGRERGAAVWIDDASVSRRHARIVVAGGKATLEDLGSKNGTLVNGELLEKPRALSDGDRIQVGRAAMTLRVLRQTGSTETASGLRRPPPTKKK